MATARPTASALVAVIVTIVAAGCALAWSLRIRPGDAWFYPATFILAAIYIAGSAASARLNRARLPWRVDAAGVRDAVLGGLALAAVFFAGAFVVRYVPELNAPVDALLDYTRVGGIGMILFTTAVNGLAEEMFYRGALWAVLPPRRRLLVTTLLYTAVTALAGVALLAFAAAALGVLVGLLRERTGSLTAPVIAHLVWSLPMLVVLPQIVG